MNIIDFIIGDSTSLDMYVLVRLIFLMLVFEFVSLIAAYLGDFKRRR